ncbi:serine phosphatase RsbU (regulator of sigma subunit) [Nonomuraea fuscirosea]|uniref:protein-serine/threonine phosphatase n=1 Tax=Nonomuraea fuscirosea TaxID=1291556 RepID=A0A2T0N848_9ACTN|nr:SpoIIE family protein phosphatase [Nonomuraea fuscirosea]PRX68971.1 serine phosphatase RsbU (regulator of sigma subunit) [Nonomuraea fuscirosea]
MSVPSGDAERPLTMGGKRSFELRDLVDAGAYVVDDGGRITQVNPRAEQLLRRGADELLGRDAHDLLHRGERGEPLPRSRCEMRGPLLTGGNAQGAEQWLERGDGTLMRISWLVTPCKGDADSLTSALVIFHETGSDTTEQWQPAPVHEPMSERDRLALLAETTTTLTSSLDVDETLRQLVRLVVPLLADWVVIDLFTEEGSVSRAVVVHYENGTLTHRAELEELLPPLAQESPMPLARALRGVAAALVGPEDYEGRPDSAITAAQQHLMAVTGIRSACIAPIRGVREVVGAVTLGRSERAEPFTTDDMLLTEDIARRAGLALDNARLYERQRRVAETMQRHLLPQLPTVPGLEMRACYVPAPDASQVGGDWYDAFVMSDGTAGLVIGDVVGHDLDAAAGMAQVCNMLRAYAGELEEPPSMVLDRLDQAVARMAEPTMATVVFARVEHANGGWQLRWTNAGHPPPLLVESDGRAFFLEAASGLLLGTGHRLPREDAVVPLAPGSTVLFYTDGLIESPSHALDDGLDRLSRHAAGLIGQPLTAFCDRFLASVRPADNDDDVALLVLRVPG